MTMVQTSVFVELELTEKQKRLMESKILYTLTHIHGFQQESIPVVWEKWNIIGDIEKILWKKYGMKSINRCVNMLTMSVKNAKCYEQEKTDL